MPEDTESPLLYYDENRKEFYHGPRSECGGPVQFQTDADGCVRSFECLECGYELDWEWIIESLSTRPA